MTIQRFSTGAFVFTRTRGLQPRDPTELEPLSRHHGIAPAFIPDPPADRVTITRAITHASRGLSREGFLLRPIRRTSTEVIYGIVQERKNESQKRLDHDFEDTVRWAAEPDPSIVSGDHDVASRVRDAYQQLRGKIVADDWSASITAYLETHDAARMRGDGRVYWVPPQRIDEIKKLAAFLAEVGIDLIMCEIEPEVQTVVQDVASSSIDEELDRLQEEADAFDGTQKPSTYSRRLAIYQQLRQRAVLYKDALGVGSDRAKQVLDELEAKVSEMLTLRKQTVIRRDGSISLLGQVSSSESEPSLEETPPDTEEADIARVPVRINFAGAKFNLQDELEGTITYVSDDDAAKKSVAMMESMGLAGTWQRAGLAEINVQNSGPEGAAVSLRFRLPKDFSLNEAATSLSTWGIEVAA